MKRIYPLLASLVLIGCASYNQLLVNPTGDVASCDSAGQGLIGIAYASHVATNCIESRKAAGYLEIEKAGVIGIKLSKDSNIILAVASNGPAGKAGIAAGDEVTAVDSQKVKNSADASILIFGSSATYVDVSILRGQNTKSYRLERVSYSELYGTSGR